MRRKRRTVDDWARLAAERGSEDGVDPKEFHAKPWDTPRRAGRKAQQLCRQVRDALHLALAGSADEALQCVTVLTVEPAPHSGRLRVLVATDRKSAATTALSRAAGYLRNEVARAVCRRHAPELVFEVVS